MKYVIFGTGDYYNRFKHWFENREVVAILDNDPKKQGTELDGRQIISPSDIAGIDYDAIVVLSFYIAEIRKQLVELGVSADQIFHFYDLHDLFLRETTEPSVKASSSKRILLLSHDLTFGGPALALYHAAIVLKKAGYEVVYASMLDGELRSKLAENFIPLIVDQRLQICTMREVPWTGGFDLLMCNTINFNVFLSDRDKSVPVIWWLHDSPFFYDGIKKERISGIDLDNIKIVSVGPVPRNAMSDHRPEIEIDDLRYGVSNVI